MLVNLTINLFNRDKVTSFSEPEYFLSKYPNNIFNEIDTIKYFKNFLKKYEPEFNEKKFSYNLDKLKKTMELSYFTSNNKMEYNMVISY